MNSLTIQILVLIASFLFYRVLRSGFDSWSAVIIDFGIVLFLFGLQYFLQRNKNSFPAGELSRLFGVTFPDKISFDDPIMSNLKPSRTIFSLEPKENIYLEPNQKSILSLASENNIDSDQCYVKNTGYYILQCSVYSDKVSYHAKLSVIGNKNNLFKSIHQGENSFIVRLQGEDQIRFELENGNDPSMILDQSKFYLIEL